MFYGTIEGNKLVDALNYPPSIELYLEEERNMIVQRVKEFDLIVEVGCMEARNIDIALNNGRKYIGVDIVEEYIISSQKMAKERHIDDKCEFLLINAERLDDILRKSKLINRESKLLFFFPFNSFGNFNDFSKSLDSIAKIKNSEFLIFSYDTHEEATEERCRYYNNCNYENLYLQIKKEGVRFVSDSGLNTMAYDVDFLTNIMRLKGLHPEVIKFANIGVAYIIKTKERIYYEKDINCRYPDKNML